MSKADESPIYNLKAVVLQTGLKPDTLRAWERRYGLPNPHRAESGHRLYSPYDVEVIRWLMERQDEGMSIGRAVDLWRQIELEEGDPLESASFNGARPQPRQGTAAPFDAGSENHIDDLRQQWITACMKFDEQTAENILSQAFSLFPAETVCTGVLQTGLAEIGTGWHKGKVTVQQEHFASELAIRRLESLMAAMPMSYRQGRVMICCPAGEEHTFPPLLLSVLLRRRGYDVVFLGANVPLRSMEVTISTTHPRLVILTAQQLFTAASLLETAQLLRKENISMAFGGLIFHRIPELTKVIPGNYLGDNLEASLEAIEKILASPRIHDAEISVSPEYAVARDYFRRHQSEIEAEIWKELVEKPIPARHLDVANRFMGRNILAALSLGNLDYIGPDLDWIEEMITHYHEMPAEMVNRYLNAYSQAVDHRLDARGAIIVNWLQKLLGNDQNIPLRDLSSSPNGDEFNSAISEDR